MSSTGHKTGAGKRDSGATVRRANGHVAPHLAPALGTTLDSLAAGVVIVTGKGEILHANESAKRMLDTKSPILSIGGYLAALQASATQELREAIAAASRNGSGIGVPLVEKDFSAATAHVLPLGADHAAATAAIFVTRMKIAQPADIGIVSRIFRFTPAESRLLRELMAGASLNEAAKLLGISVATAKTHRNHIFMKAGVSRRAELLALIARLLPPIRRA